MDLDEALCHSGPLTVDAWAAILARSSNPDRGLDRLMETEPMGPRRSKVSLALERE